MPLLYHDDCSLGQMMKMLMKSWEITLATANLQPLSTGNRLDNCHTLMSSVNQTVDMADFVIYFLGIFCSNQRPECAERKMREYFGHTSHLSISVESRYVKKPSSPPATSKTCQYWIDKVKHCQRHNGPAGWVHITSFYTNLQISFSDSRLHSINFKISTKHQYLDLKSWPNPASESWPRFSKIIS